MELAIKKRTAYLPIGFAIFSMFFGAGNSIFPLQIGSLSGEKNIFAVLGFSISTILVPILGLASIALYDGDYKQFFNRLGKIPGFVMIFLIMILIGPFAGIPRCITLSYSTLKPHLGSTPLILFSAITCAVIFLQTIKKRRLIDVLGKILTPLLLFCLAIIILKGIYVPQGKVISNTQSSSGVFFYGLTRGFQMMDLLASFFFSATVLACLKEKALPGEGPADIRQTFLKAAVLSALLLAIIYVGFSYVAANQSAFFQSIPQEALLGAVSQKILGSQLGLVMGLAVALACLTTSITLVSVFSSFIFTDCFKGKVPYTACVTGTVLVGFLFSNLGFNGICNMIAPILMVCYPSLIALTIVNVFHKTHGWESVKRPVYAVFAISLLMTLFF